MTSITSELADNIKRHRERLGLTQEHVARKIDVSTLTIGRWERSQAVPRPDKMIRLARFFRTTPLALGYDEPEALEPEPIWFSNAYGELVARFDAQERLLHRILGLLEA